MKPLSVVILFAVSSLSLAATSPCRANPPRMCDNESSDVSCNVLFPPVNGTVNDLCFNPDYAKMAALCRNTCELCCQDPNFSCEDTPVDNFTCNFNQCRKFPGPNYINCKGTCGWCELAQAPCLDQNVTECALLAFYCVDDIAVQNRCPQTCNVSCSGIRTIPTITPVATIKASVPSNTVTTDSPSASAGTTADTTVSYKPVQSPTKEPPPPPPDCRDVNDTNECLDYVRKGYCVAAGGFGEWMAVNCKKSCALCT